MIEQQDYIYMNRAIQLARRGLYTTDPNPRVGCVLVKNKQIIAEGWHHRAGMAHAEIEALSKTDRARGCTAYVTLEPCSHQGRTGPCCMALIEAGVERVVVAMQDPNPLVSGRGVSKMKAADIVVETGVLQAEAEQLNKGFIKRMVSGLPFIQSKLAMSLDGRTAMASGESKWITGPQARADVQLGRAQSSAVLTGINTVLKDDPQMNARVNFEVEQPVKVILDSQLRLPLNAKILQQADKVVLVTTTKQDAQIAQYEREGVTVIQVEAKQAKPDLSQVFAQLAERQFNHIWVEAGAVLNGALLDTDLVDEWIIYMAPCVLGDQARGLFHLPELNKMAQKKQFQLQSTRKVGSDIKMIFTALHN